MEQVPEKYGDYVYFIKERDYPKGITMKSTDSSKYVTYCRHPGDDPQKTETVLDLVEDLVNTGFVHQRYATTTVIDKIKMNHDHSLIAFTVDIGNTERLTGGVKDMKTG